MLRREYSSPGIMDEFDLHIVGFYEPGSLLRPDILDSIDLFYRQPVGDRLESLFENHPREYKDIMTASGGDMQIASIFFMKLLNAIHEGVDQSPPRKTGYFGEAWEDLFELGIVLAERTAFEAKHWIIGELFSSASKVLALKRLKKMGITDVEELEMIDVGTGSLVTGLTALMLNQDDRIPDSLILKNPIMTNVTTLDIDSTVQAFARVNYHRLGQLGLLNMDNNPTGQLTFILDNAVDYARDLERRNGNGVEYQQTITFLDPPWRAGLYADDVFVEELSDIYLLSQEGFGMQEMDLNAVLHFLKTDKSKDQFDNRIEKGTVLNGEQLVALFLKKVSPIVGMHVPYNLDSQKIIESAAKIGAHLDIFEFSGIEGNRIVREKFIVFSAPVDEEILEVNRHSIPFSK